MRQEVERSDLLRHRRPPALHLPGDDFKQLRAKAAALGAHTVLVPGRRIGVVEGLAYRCKAK